MKDRKILLGHKQVGKRFSPPMKQLPRMKEMSFVNDMLPELIWLGLTNDRIGFLAGARFFEKVIEAAIEAVGDSKKPNYALLSTYGMLTNEQREKFLDGLSRRSLLVPLREYLAPLVLLYDECPVRFLGPPARVFSEPTLVSTIKNCVGRHIDKFETPGIVLNGMILLSRLVTKTISFPSNMKLPDFNAVIDNPDSEEAKHAAGFMKANALAEFGMLDIDNSWAKYFWNRGCELSKCEFDQSNDD